MRYEGHVRITDFELCGTELTLHDGELGHQEFSEFYNAGSLRGSRVITTTEGTKVRKKTSRIHVFINASDVLGFQPLERELLPSRQGSPIMESGFVFVHDADTIGEVLSKRNHLFGKWLWQRFIKNDAIPELHFYICHAYRVCEDKVFELVEALPDKIQEVLNYTHEITEDLVRNPKAIPLWTYASIQVKLISNAKIKAFGVTEPIRFRSNDL